MESLKDLRAKLNSLTDDDIKNISKDEMKRMLDTLHFHVKMAELKSKIIDFIYKIV